MGAGTFKAHQVEPTPSFVTKSKPRQVIESLPSLGVGLEAPYLTKQVYRLYQCFFSDKIWPVCQQKKNSDFFFSIVSSIVSSIFNFFLSNYDIFKLWGVGGGTLEDETYNPKSTKQKSQFHHLMTSPPPPQKKPNNNNNVCVNLRKDYFGKNGGKVALFLYIRKLKSPYLDNKFQFPTCHPQNLAKSSCGQSQTHTPTS